MIVKNRVQNSNIVKKERKKERRVVIINLKTLKCDCFIGFGDVNEHVNFFLIKHGHWNVSVFLWQKMSYNVNCLFSSFEPLCLFIVQYNRIEFQKDPWMGLFVWVKWKLYAYRWYALLCISRKLASQVFSSTTLVFARKVQWKVSSSSLSPVSFSQFLINCFLLYIYGFFPCKLVYSSNHIIIIKADMSAYLTPLNHYQTIGPFIWTKWKLNEQNLFFESIET